MTPCPRCGFLERPEAGPCPRCGAPAAGDEVAPTRPRPDAPGSAAPGARGAAPTTRIEPGDLVPGTLLGGKYVIDRELGGGAFGRVYLAHDRGLDMKVAVKILRVAGLPAGISARDARARFLNEARALARLDRHPNIVRVYTVDEFGEIPYFVMEFFPDGTLHGRIGSSGPLAPSQAASLVADVASALTHAHRAHKEPFIHRDIKPANIFMRGEGGVLGDFGIVHFPEASPLTKQGEIIGTIPYMAPEMFKGEPADEQTDVFALGCVLYETLTAKTLFTGKTAHEQILKIVHGGEVDLAPLERSVPAPLRAILKKSLAKDPQARYATAAEMQKDLRTFLSSTGQQSEKVEPQSTDVLTPPPAIGPGYVIAGRYVFVSRLGGGGFGEVWLAKATNLGKEVAVKILPPGPLPSRMPREVARERFLREARTLAALDDHPNIVRVYDAGEENGIPYFVMEYLSAGTILDMIRRKERLEAVEAAGYAADVASALAFVHANNVIHRDLKPANIFIKGTKALLGDFGIAYLPEEAPITTGESNPGTPNYMAPELIQGETKDPRADIFSLGCVLHEMLTGRLLFGGRTQPEVIGKIMSPAEVNLRPLRDRDGIPEPLIQVMKRALAKKLADRYTVATLMEQDLRAFVADRKTAERRIWWRKLRKQAALAGSIAVMAGGAYWVGTHWPPGTPPVVDFNGTANPNSAVNPNAASDSNVPVNPNDASAAHRPAVNPNESGGEQAGAQSDANNRAGGGASAPSGPTGADAPEGGATTPATESAAELIKRATLKVKIAFMAQGGDKIQPAREAEALLTQGIQADPNSLEAYYQRGMARVALAQSSLAEELRAASLARARQDLELVCSKAPGNRLYCDAASFYRAAP